MKKKILATGGAGFIGSHLCERLVQDKENNVYSLNNYFTKKTKRGKSLTIVSPGTQKRNFTHIDGLIFGIGCDESYSVLEIAKMFGGKIEMLPERKGNRMVADVVCDKTKALGWKSKKNINDYIENCKVTNI